MLYLLLVLKFLHSIKKQTITNFTKKNLHFTLAWGGSGGGWKSGFPKVSPSAAYTHPVALNNPTHRDYHYVLHICFKVIFRSSNRKQKLLCQMCKF